MMIPSVPTFHSTSLADRASVSSSREDDTMSPEITDAAIREFLRAITDRLDEAAGAAKAAQTLAAVGRREQAVTILLDVEQPIYEVTTLLNAANLIQRYSTA